MRPHDAAYNERLARLPKWAQRRIALLEMRVAEARARLEERGPEGSLVCADPFGDPPLELGDPTVQFRIGGGRAYDNIQVRLTGDRRGLYIMGSEGVVVRPGASNTLTIGLDR